MSYWTPGALLIWLAIVLIIIPSVSRGNQMDPHVYPKHGPFFEGWYMRIIDPHHGISFGFLFARVLPSSTAINDPCILPSLDPIAVECLEAYYESLRVDKKDISSNKTDPLVYADLLVSLDPKTELKSSVAFFTPDQYNVTKNGQPIIKNPDDKTPPQFEANIGRNISFSVTPHGTKFYVSIGNSVLEGETTSPVPWGPHGEGPEGWLDKLPLPIHWFVYSLRSEVKKYKYSDKTTGRIITGNSRSKSPVVAHLEKNWGQSFPKAWIWAEGVNIQNNVSFSVSSGILTVMSLDIPAQLSGYRNPRKGIHCSFSPANSVHTLSHDGCLGQATLRVTSIECEVTFQLLAPPETFSSCLYGPYSSGFKKACIESYSATANVTVFQRKEFQLVLTDSQIIQQAALEFGEEYMCNKKCPSKNTSSP